MTTIVPSWATLETMARNAGISFEQSDKRVTMEDPTTGAFGDFYPQGHEEAARWHAHVWLQKTLATVAAMREEAKG